MERRQLAYGFFLAVSILILINVLTGSYFEEYERLIQLFVIEEIANFGFLHLEAYWFLIIPFLAKLSGILPSLPVFSVFYSLMNFLILSSTLLAVHVIVKKETTIKWLWYLAPILIALFIIDNFIFISNRRVAFLATISSVLLIYNSISYPQNRNLFRSFSFLLLGIAFFCRIEIVVIGLVLSVIFFIVFYDKRVVIMTSKMLLLSLLFFASHSILQRMYLPEINTVLRVEHEVHDRNNIEFNYDDEKQFTRQWAMSIFIQDEPAFNREDYELYLNSLYIKDFYFRPDFLAANKKRIERLVQKLFERNSSIVFLFFLNAFILLFVLLSTKKYKQLGRYVLFVLGSAMFFLLLNTYLDVPGSLIVVSLGFLTSFAFLYSIIILKKKSFLILCIVLLNIVVFGLFFNHEKEFRIRNESESNRLANNVRDEMKEKINQGSILVFSNLPDIISEDAYDFNFYPSKLFTQSKNTSVDHYYLDLFFISRYELYYNKHVKLFGEGINSLTDRIETCINDDRILFISTDSYNEFLSKYLLLHHGMSIQFEKTGSLSLELGLDYYDINYEQTGTE